MLRAVVADTGVSAGLILHRSGSRGVLRGAGDALAQIPARASGP